MATWLLRSNATTGDRLLNTGQAAVQLSSGLSVFLVDDPSASNPNRISLALGDSAHTATPTTIATLSTDNFNRGGYPLSVALCRDASDNLYVVGRDAGSSDHVGCQAFKKGTGNTWSQQGYNSADTSNTDGHTLAGFVAVWCNSGGGTNAAGHILVIANDTGGNNYVLTLDAGKALQGSSGISYSARNPTFLGSSTGSLAGSNLDVSRDGFGATSGLAIVATDTTHVKVGAWGITSSGSITTGGGLVDAETSGTLSTTTKCRLVRYNANAWVALYPSSSNAGQLTARSYSSTAMLGNVDTGVASNFPAPSASLSWDAATGAPAALQVWVFAWSTQAAHLDDLLRLPISLTTLGVPSVGAVVVDNTSVSGGGASADMTTLRLVKDPVDALHTDWQAYKSTSTYGMLGYYAALPAAPNAPTLTSPTSGSVVAPGAVPVNWLFTSGVVGDVQTGAYVRVQISGGAYQWWTGATLSASEVVVTGLTTAQTVSITGLTSSSTYSYSVQTIGATGLLSGYAAAVSFIVGATPPSQPTLTAAYDSATNRTVLTVAGTGVLLTLTQYSDDSGVTWNTVRGASALPLVAGALTLYDYEIPPLGTRSYRVQQSDPSQGIYGAPSLWSATQTAVSTLSTFWLKDPVAQTVGVAIHVVRGSLKVHRPEAFTEHRPLGRVDAVIISDVVGLEDGAIAVWSMSASDETALQVLIQSQKTLLLQAPDGSAWFVRIAGARTTDRPYLTKPGRYLEHALVWYGQNRPA